MQILCHRATFSTESTGRLGPDYRHQLYGLSNIFDYISSGGFNFAKLIPDWWPISVSLSLSFCFILNAMVVTRVGITYGHGADTECKWYSFVSAQNRKQIKPTIHLRTQVVCLTEWWINTHRLFLSLNSKASDCYTIQFDSVVYRTVINSGACFHSLIIIFVFVFVFLVCCWCRYSTMYDGDRNSSSSVQLSDDKSKYCSRIETSVYGKEGDPGLLVTERLATPGATVTMVTLEESTPWRHLAVPAGRWTFPLGNNWIFPLSPSLSLSASLHFSLPFFLSLSLSTSLWLLFILVKNDYK